MTCHQTPANPHSRRLTDAFPGQVVNPRTHRRYTVAQSVTSSRVLARKRQRDVPHLISAKKWRAREKRQAAKDGPACARHRWLLLKRAEVHMKPLIHLILLAISLLLLAVPIADSSVIDTLPWKDIQYMFVLYNVPFDFATDPSSGDSYSSVGYSPAGTHPSSANPIGNPAFPGKTTAYGANWVLRHPSTRINSTLGWVADNGI